MAWDWNEFFVNEGKMPQNFYKEIFVVILLGEKWTQVAKLIIQNLLKHVGYHTIYSFQWARVYNFVFRLYKELLATLLLV